MEEFTARQFHDSCKLALPEGLKDLMSDISREVLRAQPENLYKYIADYLSALLVTREHLSIACRLCGDICENICHPAFVDELKSIGLNVEDAETAAEIVAKYFEKGGTREDKLMLKLIKETEIEEHQLPEVQSAMQNVFLRQKLKNFDGTIETSSDSKLDPVTRAVKHTMKIYESTEPTQQQQCVMAEKIQAVYKGYGVRRHIPKEDAAGSNVQEQPEPEAAAIKWGGLRSLSSISIAGSLMKLPSHKPYKVSDLHHDASTEQERAIIDYTLHHHESAETKKKTFKKKSGDLDERPRKIKFHSAGDPSEVIDDEADDADDESDESIVDESGVADDEDDKKERKDSLNDNLVEVEAIDQDQEVAIHSENEVVDERKSSLNEDLVKVEGLDQDQEDSINFIGDVVDVEGGNDQEEATGEDEAIENGNEDDSSRFTETKHDFEDTSADGNESEFAGDQLEVEEIFHNN